MANRMQKASRARQAANEAWAKVEAEEKRAKTRIAKVAEVAILKETIAARAEAEADN